MTATALVVAAPAFAQGRGGAPACTTLACDVQGDFDRTRTTMTGIASAMPEDKFGFKPTAPQRTFAEQVMHIATIDVMLWATLGGKTPAPTLNAKATAKADVMAELAKAYDYQAAVLKEFATDAQLIERVKSLPFMGPTVSRLRLVNFSFGHSQDIYGQMAVYLRLNGVIPPASNRGGV
jgi:uncharacterized damage-inducible protein DinB